ncbi:hypothetical protein Tsubulata_029047 [Turnera subulata]|uniref:Glycosyltransferase n=1 Tax=Turnera subulata TaxID=218843 RepID=A0A9Q0J263_9ROSI|nr:hypothetical protein Tsubulata_029047 [Turnera subulata]
MVSTKEQLHVMFLPYMAPGHMMPMVDIARIFAADGVRVTIITTTRNATPFQNAIDRDIESGRSIALEILAFPCAEAGLPEGCENLYATPTPEMSMKLFHGIELLTPQIKRLFYDHHPDCIASDYLFPWTVDVAVELGIPRLAFSGSGFFNLCVAYCMEHYQPHSQVSSETETFVVPSLPHEVRITRSQLPDIVKETNEFSGLFDKLREAERNSYGILMNSYYELEAAYVDYYMKVTGTKAWCLGPLSLLHKCVDDRIESEHSCLHWLDTKKAKSVLYICFGSLSRFSKAQTSEIANALEESGHSFIWVIGKTLKSTNGVESEDKDQQQEYWLPEGFENRIEESGKGLIVRGWAPQVLILEHPAIGAFFTHCGWNSILEGLSAGVAFLTWPGFAEQFYNEKLITQVLKIGVPVGNEHWKVWATQESPLIGRNEIEKAVRLLMDETDETVEMRERASQLAELAKNAVQEGGSSYRNMKALIEDIRNYKHSND